MKSIVWKDKYKIFVWFVFCLIILILGYLLRKDNYDTIPLPGTSMDEYSYSWVGLSLIESRYPVGISGINGYKNQLYKYINVDDVYQSTAGGNPLKINYPWFDHPPMMGLITGGYAWTKGVHSFEDTNSYLIRKPMLWLGSLTIFSLMVLLLLNNGYLVSLTGGLIWAVVPSFVLGSRMIQAENGLIPFWLISLIFLSLYIKKRKLGLLIIAALFAGFATLFKISGVVCLISAIIILIRDSNKNLIKDIFVFSFYYLLISSLFIVYGLSIDAGQFITTFVSNGSRYYGIGSESIYRLLTQTKLTNLKYVTEPWLLISWLAFFVRLSKKRLTIYSICLSSYLAVYILFGSYAYGWYSFPFWPFLVSELAIVVVKSIKSKISPIWAFWGLLVVVGYYLTKFVSIEEFQKYSFWWKNSIFIVSLLLMVYWVKKKKPQWVKKIVFLFLFVLLLAAICLSVKYNTIIDIDYWYKLS